MRNTISDKVGKLIAGNKDLDSYLEEIIDAVIANEQAEEEEVANSLVGEEAIK